MPEFSRHPATPDHALLPYERLAPPSPDESLLIVSMLNQGYQTRCALDELHRQLQDDPPTEPTTPAP